MRRSRSFVSILLIPLALGLAGQAEASPILTMSLTPDRDNSLFQSATNMESNGAGQHLFTGRINSSFVRRALIHFDVAGALPSGAQVQSASLGMYLEDIAMTESQSRNVELHRVTSNWGEGTSNTGTGMMSGMGAPATTNDTTWTQRFYNTTPWTTPGGDFSATVSGSTSVGIATIFPTNLSTWNSTPAMVADVQSWLDSSSTNFGWLILNNESATQTNRRFASREFSDPAQRPLLTITYTVADTTANVVPEPSSFALGAIAIAAGAAVTYLRRRYADRMASGRSHAQKRNTL